MQVFWASFWDGAAFMGRAVTVRLNSNAERPCSPFCILLPICIHGWTVLLTDLIFSCHSQLYYPASGLNLQQLNLVFALPEALTCCSSLHPLFVPSLCHLFVLSGTIRRHSLHLLIPPLVVKKKKSHVVFFHLLCAGICPGSYQQEFSSDMWIAKLISICSKQTDLTTKCQKGTRILCAHLKEH